MERYVRSLLDYVERNDPPSALVEGVRGIAAQFGIRAPSSSYPSGSNTAQRGSSPQSAFASTAIPDVTERHSIYFFHDGDVDLICRSDDRRTIFRIHGQRLVQYSPAMSGLLSQDKLNQLPLFDGRPQIPWDDDPVEFTILLEVLYNRVLPFGTNRPPFREFASLLRLVTKYEINTVRDVLLENFRTIYAPGQGSRGVPINRDYFGDPQPHPNEVLKLFYECQVEFALPFAFYEACVAGIKSLTSTDPSIRLPPVPLSQAVRGFCTLQEWEWKLARSILLLDRQSHTSSMCRPLDLRSTNSGSPLQDVLRAICPEVGVRTGGILHILDFPNGENCVDCVRRWNEIKHQAKMELWKSLPETFGMESWTEIYSKGNNRAT